MRVQSRTKSTRGKDVSCTTCGRSIQPGETYYRWSFRYGGTYYACKDHYPKQSQLTQSKMSEVYSALEDLQASVDDFESMEDVENALSDAAGRVTEVAGEYTEAAESFGGQGPNAERGEALAGFASDLESTTVPEIDDHVVPQEERDEEYDHDEALQAWRDEVRNEINSLEPEVF